MAEFKDFISNDEITWCPGCGDFGILNALKKALVRLSLSPKDILLVSGIGQASKTPHYIKCNCFNGLHGRALPPAQQTKGRVGDSGHRSQHRPAVECRDIEDWQAIGS